MTLGLCQLVTFADGNLSHKRANLSHKRGKVTELSQRKARASINL